MYKSAEKNVTEFSQNLVNKVEFFDRINQKDSAEKLVKLMIEYHEQNPNSTFLVNYYMMQKKRSFLKHDYEGFANWDSKRLAFEPFASINNKLSNSIINWGYCFEQDQYDSCINLLENSLMLSKVHNDTFYRSSIYVNLGATYFELKQYSKASMCFYEALLSPNLSPIHEKILALNLMVFLNHEQKFKEVKEIYKRYQNVLNPAVISPELHELSLLLRANAALFTERNQQIYKEFIHEVDSKPLSASNQDLYLRIKANIFIKNGYIDSLNAIYQRFKNVLHQDLPYKIETHYDNLIYLGNHGYWVFDVNALLSEFNSLPESNYYATYYYAKLFGAYYSSLNNTSKAQYWNAQAHRYFKLNQTHLESFKKSNIKNALLNAKTELGIKRKRFNIERTQLENRKLLITGIGIVILCILIITLFTLQKWNQEKRFQLLQIEHEISQKNLEIEKENLVKNRGLTLKSGAIFQTIEDIIPSFDQLNFRHPVLDYCKQELMEILHIDEHENTKPTTELSNVYAPFSFLRSQFKALNNINDTTFKIIIHSILDTSPKDISNLLNINVQYVRNVRSKLKKDLNEEIQGPWDWNTLIKF